MRGTSGVGSGSFLVVFFVLTITFCLISGGIFKANTTIGMAAYAKKSKKPSEGSSDKEGGGDSSDKSGDKSSGGGDKSGGNSSDKGDSDNKNIDQPTDDIQKQPDQEPGSKDGSSTGTDDTLQQVGPLTTGEDEDQGTEPIAPPVDTTTPPPPPPPTTCEKDPSSLSVQQEMSNRTTRL
jgi:hypothetical protein